MKVFSLTALVFMALVTVVVTCLEWNAELRMFEQSRFMLVEQQKLLIKLALRHKRFATIRAGIGNAYLYNLKTMNRSEKKFQEHMAQAVREARAQRSLINQIFDLDKIEDQKIFPFWLDLEKEDELRNNIALLESARHILIPWSSAAVQVMECRLQANPIAAKTM